MWLKQRRRRQMFAPNRRWTTLCCGVAAVFITLGAAHPGHATIVERVVAVVGDRAILLSEVMQRARASERRLYRQVDDAASRAVALHELRRQTLERMVDEILELQVARRAGINVSTEEVERAVEMQANANGLNRQQLEQEVVASGLTMDEYLREIRGQLLSARLVNMHSQGRGASISDEALRATYRRLQLEERRQLPIRVAGIRVAITPPADPVMIEAARELAQSLMSRAGSEQAFRELASRYSSDAASVNNDGVLPASRSTELPEVIGQAIDGAEPGELIGPVRVGDAFWILALLERGASTLPSFESAKSQLAARVQNDTFLRTRSKWLEGLRRQQHVDIRL